ncbi:MAG: hypothetical protein U0235_17035 [Polyangiaceae bacterium]
MKLSLANLRLASALASASAALLALLAAPGCSSAPSTEEPTQSEGALASDRPPQFVLLAFDGSLNLDFWRESRQFAKTAGVKFTYFISGTYFLADAKKTSYQGPHHAAGKSDIGFGGDAAAIKARLEQLRLARSEGHEMGSHANGHFDGTAWTSADWESEFQAFDKLIFQAGPMNGFAQPNIGFALPDVVGFRAPLLGQGPGLYTTLSGHHYLYDTSKTAAVDYWPEKKNGVWNFPLAQLRVVGSGKKTLSMDYNFYFTQSNGVSKPENKELYKKEMLDTYMQYFETNYFGNRAPVNIGHHFSKWNGGAYWEAMQTFAKRVCGQPEVKCVTYKELMGFVEANADKIPAWKAGQFNKMPKPPSAGEAAEIEPAVADEDLEAAGFVRDGVHAHEEETGGSVDEIPAP